MRFKVILKTFFCLTVLSLLSLFLFSSDLYYPYVSTKALVFRIIIAAALPFYAYLILAQPKLRPSLKNHLNLAVLAFFLINLLAAFTGINFIRSFWGNYERMGGVYQLAHLVLLYFYLLLIGQEAPRWLRTILQTIVVFGVLSCVYAFLIKLGMPVWFPDSDLTRSSSFFGNPIFFASFLILPMALSLWLWRGAETRVLKIWYIAAFIIQFIGLYISYTRGALVGAVVGLLAGYLMWVFKQGGKKLKLFSLIAVIIVVAGVLIFALIGRQSSGQLGLGRLLNFQDSNSQARLIQWKTALRGSLDRPLLGVGPENYYFVANKYFDPLLYKYDPSWFDKPHNYPLEILSTTGILGLLAYLGILGLTVYGFYLGYKKNFLDWLEYCLLTGGVIAYLVQNLFAFDTVAASMMFFAYTAFAGFLLQQSLLESEHGKSKPHNKNQSSGNPWPAIVAGIVAVLCLYGIYVTDINTMKVLNDLVYATSISTQNPQKAEAFFEDASNQPFVSDVGDLGVRATGFAVAVAQDFGDKLDKNFVNQVLNNAIAVMQRATTVTATNPVYWNDLGNLYATSAVFNKSGFDPKAEDAIYKAIALVPNRVEPLYFLVQDKALQNDTAGAVALSEKILQMTPDNPEAQWRLSLAYHDAKRIDDAVRMAETALNNGYQIKLAKEGRWLVNYYADKQNYPMVLMLYKQMIAAEPNDFQLHANLAAAYAKVGDKQDAILESQKVIELNPAAAPDVNAFIKTLQ